MAYTYLLRAFSLEICNKTTAGGCLDYHLQKCAGTCKENFDKEAYRERLTNALKVLQGNYETLLKDLYTVVKFHTQRLEFEKAHHVYEFIINFDMLTDTLKANFTEQK